MSIKFSKTPGNNEIRLSTDTKVQMWDPRKTKDKPVFNFHENGAGTVKFSSTQEKLFRALAGGHLCGSCDDYDNANVLTEADLKDAKKRFIDKDKSLFGDINVTEFRYDEQAGIVNLTTDKGDILRIDLLTKSEKAVQEANKKNGKTVSGQTNTTPSAPAKAKPDNTKTKPDASKKPAVKTNIQSKKNITTAKTTKNSKKADEKTQKAAAKNTTKAVQKKKEEAMLKFDKLARQKKEIEPEMIRELFPGDNELYEKVKEMKRKQKETEENIIKKMDEYERKSKSMANTYYYNKSPEKSVEYNVSNNEELKNKLDNSRDIEKEKEKTKNEKEIQDSIDKICKNKNITTIIIAHRLSTVKNADIIYVINNGKIAEYGKVGELMENKGIFERMWNDYQTAVEWRVV